MEQPKPETGGEVADLLDQLRTVIDEREEWNKQDKELKAIKNGIEAQLFALAEKLGTDIFRTPRLTVAFTSATRYNVDPAKWEEFFQWAVENGHTHVLYKKASGKPFDEMIAQGGGIPEMVTMEDYTKLSARRG